MSRLRVILLSMGLVIAVLTAQSVSQAQAPGGERGGDRGGRGGRGGFGGFGRVWSPLRLASNKYVQEDLKLTDAQKEQVKALSDKEDARRKSAFSRRDRSNDNTPGNGQANGQAKASGDAPKSDAAGTKGQGGRTRGGATANNDGGNGNRGNRGFNNGGGFGGFGGPGGFNRAEFESRREREEQAQAEAEAALGRILNKTQRDRIAQIRLQQEGPMAVTQPAIQKKLNFSPDQSEQIAMILNQRREAQGAFFQQGREAMAAFQTPDGRFDREAYQAKMQDPQFKAQADKRREESTKQMEQLQDQTITMIGKTMTKKQHQNFVKMKGVPFDLEKLEPNYDPAVAAAKAKEKEEAEAAANEDASSSKKGSSKKKTSTKSRRN